MNDATITNGYTPLEILAAMTVIDNLIRTHDKTYLYIAKQMNAADCMTFEHAIVMRCFELEEVESSLDRTRVSDLTIAMLKSQAWRILTRIELFQSRLNSKF